MISNFIKNGQSKQNFNFRNDCRKEPNWFLKKIIDQFNFLIFLPIDDHQYIQPYEIKEKVKNLKKISIECCLNINDALNLVSKIYIGKV